MDRIDKMLSLKQMYGVINYKENCEYNASKGAKKSKVSTTKYDQLKNMSKDSFE